MLVQMKRWGFVKGEVSYKDIAEKVFRAAEAQKLFKEIGLDVPTSTYARHVIMGKTFDGVVREFIRTLLDSLPGSAPEDVFWGYNFLTGAMTLADMMCSRMGFAARVMLQL